MLQANDPPGLATRPPSRRSLVVVLRSDDLPVLMICLFCLATLKIGRMMINVDVSATAFFQGIPLIEFVMKILGLRSPGKRDLSHLSVREGALRQHSKELIIIGVFGD